jgi:endonuclease YncB( thermonuclease family)
MRALSAIFIICLLALTAAAQTISGKVVAIADGDTITILDDRNQQHKIRINGIDAPESNQAFGDKSKRSLSDTRTS